MLKGMFNLFIEILTGKFQIKENTELVCVKDNGSNIPVIHPNAANGATGMLFCAAIFTLLTVMFVFWTKLA